MNVIPEGIGRLRRLVAAKRKDPQWNDRPDKNGEKNKEELQTNAKQNKEIETNSGSGSSTGTNGRISLVLSKKIETENDAATPGNKETINESDIKMDMDFFRQMLKEVIVKRTFEIEKRLMGDVEALKKQVLALETEKKKLVWDAKRLQRTLNEISSKHKGQERPGYSQIDNKVAETSIPEKPVSPNLPQKTDKMHHASEVDSEAADSYKIDGNTTRLEQVRSSERQRGSPDSRVSCNTSEVVTSNQVPVTVVDDATRSLAQNGRGSFTRSSFQGQPSDTQELHLHTRGNESAHRHLPEVRIEAPRPLQGEMPQPPARPAASPNSQTHGQPSVRLTSQELPAASSPNITCHVQGQLSSQPQWLPSQPQRPNNQVQMTQPTQADDVPSHSYPVVKRGPPNVSLFNPYKRKRVDKRTNSNDLHVVSSNSNYVMHNFKLQKTPTALDNLRKRFKTSVPNSGGNQAMYTTSPSNQLRGPYLNQSSSNAHPVVYPEHHPFHETDKAPVQPQGLPQGQLVERIFYPSTRPRQVSTEYGPRIMSAHPRHQMEPAHANGQPVEPNGTMYVVREYQVPQQGAPIQAEHVPPSHRTAQLQHIAPAPPGIPRSQPHPPVQSPGISSTASPLGRHPGDPNVGHDPRGTANQSGTAVRNDHPGVPLRTPPKPSASIVVVQDGIVLSWNMGLDETMAKIDNYELFACQDGAESTTPPIMWKKIGIVKALPLPMACTLSQFSSGNKYHFAVRAVDDQERAGPFSDPCTISLTS